VVSVSNPQIDNMLLHVEFDAARLLISLALDNGTSSDRTLPFSASGLNSMILGGLSEMAAMISVLARDLHCDVVAVYPCSGGLKLTPLQSSFLGDLHSSCRPSRMPSSQIRMRPFSLY
jgi:hypothetical protein